MMVIEQYFEAAEKKHKQKLELFLKEIFSGFFLPCHGPEHHMRVWRYAIELASSAFADITDEEFAEKLIIACYLHDAGMVIDTGERHGVMSLGLCRTYLRMNSLREDDFKDVLEVIETHDDKKYLPGQSDSHLKILLNAADDMDAFGIIGIYRYIGICLERKVPLKLLGGKIMINAAARFENFRHHFSRIEGLFNHHRDRYRVLEDFWMNYNRESANYKFGEGTPTGYAGIAEIIGEMSRQKVYPGKVMQLFIGGNYPDDRVIRGFFDELEKELSA